MKIIFIIIVILVILALINRNLQITNEAFTNSNKQVNISKNRLYSVIPAIYNKFCDSDIVNSDNEHQLYFGTYIPNPNQNNSNIVYTYSLESDRWYGPLPNSIPDANTIITRLTYDKDHVLMGIGLNIKNGEDNYSIYKKENLDICSKWVKVPESNDQFKGKMSSIMYDSDHKLMGLHCKDGQIYKKETEDIQSKWIGPINYDNPINHFMFDMDGSVIGIKDNCLLKKEGDWKKTKWSIQNTLNDDCDISDIFPNTDGTLGLITNKGLKVQDKPSFKAKFYKLNQVKKHKNNIISKSKIIKAKTGVSHNLDSHIDDSEIGDQYTQIIDFKKNLIDMCSKRGDGFKQLNNNTDNMVSGIKDQNTLISEIDNKIHTIKKKYKL